MKSLLFGSLLMSSLAFAQPKGYTPTAEDLKTMTPPTPPLDPEDQRILERGEISTARYITGGILGTYPLGFGVGHAIQGRYHDKGWIFTVGELGSLAIAAAGASNCMDDSESGAKRWGKCKSGLMVAGALAFTGFRIWEIFDLWFAPPKHNQRYRQLKEQQTPTTSLYLMPTPSGGAIGLQWRF